MDTVFTATVLVSLPELGLAVLIPSKGFGCNKTPLLGLLPRTDKLDGASTYTALSNGTTVSCYFPFSTCHYVACIQSVANVTADSLDDSWSGRMLSPSTPAKQVEASADVSIKLLETGLLDDVSKSFVRNHSNGVDADSMPGDIDIVDGAHQCGVHIGRSIAGLRAGGLASVDVMAAPDCVRLTGDTVRVETTTHESEVSRAYSVRNTATTISEAFGLASGGILKQESDSTVTPVDANAIPLNRIQHVEGYVAAGVEDIISDFPITGKHTAQDEPALLSRRRQALSGALTDASTFGLASIKTPFVSGVVQVGYGKTPLNPATITEDGDLKDGESIDDLRESYAEPYSLEDLKADEISEDANVSVEDEVTDAAINKLVDRLMEGDYSKALMNAMARHGFAKASESAAVKNRFASDTVIGGVTGAQHYPLPECVELQDPVSKQNRRYYNSTSFISQEPDGSICIADGYGSEIRMCRGNIYIAPALDLIFRPGRNMYGMVPGHISLNAQQRCDLESGTDAVTLRAAGDVKLASGADDSGAHRGNVTIENLSKGGGDIYIRSTGNMAVTARQSMLLGKDPESDTACHMQIDTGAGGALYMRGEQATLESAQTVIGGLSQGSDTASGSALVVDQSQISLFSQLVSAPAHLYMNRAEKQPTVGVVRGGVKKTANIATATSGDVIVDGNLIVNKQLAVNEGAALKFVVTAGLAETTEKYYKKHNHVKVAANKNIVTRAGDSSAQLCETLGKSIYSKKTLAETTFKYPDTYGMQMDTMPGMLWQQRSTESGNPGNKWKEPEVNGTLPFPGKKVWDSAKISETGYRKEATLKSDYVTNN